MYDILNKKVQIVTMGENIKYIICLIDSDTKRLTALVTETTDEKTKQLFTININYNNSLKKELQSQLDEQI